MVDCLFNGACVVAGGAGRDPIGPIDEAGALESEAGPSGDEAEELSPCIVVFALGLGEETLLDGDLVGAATGEGPAAATVESGAKRSTPRGEGPRPVVVARVGIVISGRSPERNAGLSLPYRARCWRAINSRRLSSFVVAGLKERSDLFPDISA